MRYSHSGNDLRNLYCSSGHHCSTLVCPGRLASSHVQHQQTVRRPTNLQKKQSRNCRHITSWQRFVSQSCVTDTIHSVLDHIYIALQDALERAYEQDVSGHTAEASKLYRLSIATIFEGLALQVPTAWLTGSNVNKWRSNLNKWLQSANDRYCS